MMVNAVRIVTKIWERRPVILNGREEQLYRVAFSSIDKREFLRLMSLVRWVDCSPGEVILAEGQLISRAIVVISGEIEAVLSSKTRIALRPGQLVGTVAADCGLASPVEFVARGPCISGKVGPAAADRVCGQQTATPRQASYDCKRGPCYKTDAVSGLTRENIISGLPLLGA
jgi:hypothetical protein